MSRRAPSRVRKFNASKLREASRIAMQHEVLIFANLDELKTVSLAAWRDEGQASRDRRAAKIVRLRGMCQELGTFSAMPGETRYEVFLRMWEEALFAGALLGEMPEEEWVCGASAHQSA